MSPTFFVTHLYAARRYEEPLRPTLKAECEGLSGGAVVSPLGVRRREWDQTDTKAQVRVLDLRYVYGCVYW
jgi:hypothetical protein